MLELQLIGQVNLFVVLQDLSLFEFLAASRTHEAKRIGSVFQLRVLFECAFGFIRNIANFAAEVVVLFDVLGLVSHQTLPSAQHDSAPTQDLRIRLMTCPAMR